MALRRMGIAGREQRTWRMHRHIERRAGAEILVVEIAGVDAGRSAADAAHGAGRRDAHGAEERAIERHHHAARNLRSLGRAIDRNDALPKGRELLRQRAIVGALAVVAVIDRETDIENAHLEHVAGLGAAHFDRTGENMRAGAAILHVAIDVAQILRDRAWRHDARALDRLGLHRGRGLDGDEVAGIDAQDRLHVGGEVPDVHGLRARHQSEFSRPRESRAGDEQERACGKARRVARRMIAGGGTHTKTPRGWTKTKA